MGNIANQHDKYFKELFSRKEEMIDFITHALPQIAEYLDINTLQLDTTQYIDKRLQIGYSDLVYNCIYKNKIKLKIALLFEHKSYIESFPILQLMGYMLKIWETNIKQEHPLMPVIPIIFYHGKDEWKNKKIDEYFVGIDENLKRYLPKFDFELIDTKKFTDDQIKQMFKLVSLKIGILLMKHIFDDPDTLIQELDIILENLQHLLETENGRNLYETSLIYLFSNLKHDKQKVTEKIKQISNKGGEIAETIAQKLHKEGRIEATKQVALKMIKDGVDDEIIMKYTNLNNEQLELLKQYLEINETIEM
jgi:predicted transposase/invertase (TIGR01784 family)